MYNDVQGSSKVRWGGGGSESGGSHQPSKNDVYVMDEGKLNELERRAEEMIEEEDERRRLFDLLSENMATSTQPTSELTDKARLRALKEHRILSVIKSTFPDDVFNNDAEIRLVGPPLPGSPLTPRTSKYPSTPSRLTTATTGLSSTNNSRHDASRRGANAPDVVDFIHSFLGPNSNHTTGGGYSVSHLLPVSSRYDAGNDACYALVPKERAERYLSDYEVRGLVDQLLAKELALLDAQIDNESDAIQQACELEASLQIQQARVREAASIFAVKVSETNRLIDKADEIRSRKSLVAGMGSTRGFMALGGGGSSGQRRGSEGSELNTSRGGNDLHNSSSYPKGDDGGYVSEAVSDVLQGHKELHEAIHELNRHRRMKAAMPAASASTAGRGWGGGNTASTHSPSRLDANLSAINNNNNTVNSVDANYYGSKYYGALMGSPRGGDDKWGKKHTTPNNKSNHLDAPVNPYIAITNESDDDGISNQSFATSIFSPSRINNNNQNSSSRADPRSEQSISMAARREAQKVLSENDPMLFRRILQAADEYRNNELKFDDDAVANQRAEETKFAKELKVVCEVRSEALDLEVSKLTTQRLIIESGPHALGARTLELYDILSQLAVVRKAMSLEEEYLGIAQSDALVEQDRFQTFEQLKQERDAMLEESRKRLAAAHELQRIARSGFLTTYRRLTGQEPLPFNTNTFLDPADTKDIVSRVREELADGDCSTLLRLCRSNCEELLPTPKETWEATRHWYT